MFITSMPGQVGRQTSGRKIKVDKNVERACLLCGKEHQGENVPEGGRIFSPATGVKVIKNLHAKISSFLVEMLKQTTPV